MEGLAVGPKRSPFPRPGRKNSPCVTVQSAVNGRYRQKGYSKMKPHLDGRRSEMYVRDSRWGFVPS
jgi:hypothetical protein